MFAEDCLWFNTNLTCFSPLKKYFLLPKVYTVLMRWLSYRHLGVREDHLEAQNFTPISNNENGIRHSHCNGTAGKGLTSIRTFTITCRNKAIPHPVSVETCKATMCPPSSSQGVSQRPTRRMNSHSHPAVTRKRSSLDVSGEANPTSLTKILQGEDLTLNKIQSFKLEWPKYPGFIENIGHLWNEKISN